MHLIICIDKNNGMMFNGRRQSQDQVLRRKVLELCGGSKLWMNHYSAKQFTEHSNICVDEAFLSKAETGEFCFVEDGEIPEKGVEKIYLFHWNRRYPADIYFDYDLKGHGFKKIKSEDFVGSSHDKITLEVYELRES